MEEARASTVMMFITVPGQSDNTDNKCVLVLRRRNIVDYITRDTVDYIARVAQ